MPANSHRSNLPGKARLLRVSNIQVKGLFHRFNHTLGFKDDNRIAIMIGPNGFGKTMMLRIIDTLFNGTFDDLASMPFSRISIQFDDKSELKAECFSSQTDHNVKISYRISAKEQWLEYTPKQIEISLRDLGIPREYIEETIPYVRYADLNTWMDTRSGERLNLRQLVNRFSEYLPMHTTQELSEEVPEWLREILDNINVRFIEIDRLVNASIPAEPPVNRVVFGRWPTPVTQRTVRVYSDDIGNQVNDKLSEYGAISQERDRTFPGRLVQEINSSPLSDDELHTQLSEIEEKRSEIVQAGLMPQDDPEWGGTALNQLEVNDSTKGVMTVYARDAQDKLSVFDDLLGKVQALKRIANSRFIHKTLSIGREGIQINSNGSQLDLEMLSSGEQHELVLIYDLLFRVKKNSLILIDEPELSLHVAWQKQFLSDLEEMAKLSDFQSLIATHSPQVINNRWDLTIELKDPDLQ